LALKKQKKELRNMTVSLPIAALVIAHILHYSGDRRAFTWRSIIGNVFR
jgi:hypothetical protein